MTRKEAEAEARRLNAEPEGKGFWVAQRVKDDVWRVVHADAPGFKQLRATGVHVESKPKPPEPADPRPGAARDVPGYF